VNLDRVFNIAGMIVGVGLVTVIVSNKNTANVIKAVGGAFSGSLKTAMGR
jgi:PRD1 phage membrane DNA delivery